MWFIAGPQLTFFFFYLPIVRVCVTTRTCVYDPLFLSKNVAFVSRCKLNYCGLFSLYSRCRCRCLSSLVGVAVSRFCRRNHSCIPPNYFLLSYCCFYLCFFSIVGLFPSLVHVHLHVHVCQITTMLLKRCFWLVQFVNQPSSHSLIYSLNLSPHPGLVLALYRFAVFFRF